MCKVKFGMMMTDARGKLGGQVFSKNRSGSYVRTKVTPSNPQSEAQQGVRSTLGAISSQWSDLTDAQRASFNTAVPNWQKTDIFGDLKSPTGKNLFTALNINLVESGQPQILVAPEKTEIPFLDIIAITGSVAAGTLVVTAAEDLAGFTIQVSATPMLSNGTGFYKGKFRKIANVDGAFIAVYAAFVSYSARFGVPVLGANIAFQFKVIAPNGQAGVPFVVKAVINA